MQKKWLIAVPLILILLVLCVAIVVVGLFAFSTARVQGISAFGGGNLNFAAQETEERSFAVDSPAKLTVNNFAGQVHVEKGSANEIVVETTKEARGVSQQDAEKNLEKVTIIMDQSGDALDIRVALKQGEVHWAGKVDFVIRVPEQTQVKVDADNGDLYLAGTEGAAELATDFGSVLVKDVKGGALTVDAGNGHIEVSGVQAGDSDIDLRSDFGDINLSDAAGRAVTIKSQNGKLTLKDVDAAGKMALTSDFGQISYEAGRAGSLDVKTQNGEVTLSKVTSSGKLLVDSDFGTIRVTDCKAQDYDLETPNGGIYLDGAAGKIKAHTDFGDVEVKHASDAVLDMKSQNGGVRFEGSLGKGPHTLRSEFGNVLLRLPDDQKLDIELKTEFGEIESEFEVSLSGSLKKDHWTGKINGGGDSLTATTANGNITLEIAR